jgi:hypothetical protein
VKEELSQKLEQLVAALGIERFSAAEMVELLEDGEDVDWVIEQVLPENKEGEAKLRPLLGEIAAEVGPEPSAEAVDAADAEEPAEDAEDIDWNDLSDVELPDGVSPEQIKELMNSPRGALMADFGAFCEEKGYKPAEDTVGEEAVNESLREIEEEWLDTPRETLDGKKPRDMLNGGRLFPTKVETYKREQPKIGRNDPCSCGSGKKYKKCCGKAA